MNKRNLKLEKYGISKHRYMELMGFCRQYPEWKQALQEITYIRGKEHYASPKPTNYNVGDPVGNSVIRKTILETKIKLIEDAAKETDKDLYEYIIKGVCYNVPITYLEMIEGMPCGKSAYFEKRRYFFYLLDKAKSTEF